MTIRPLLTSEPFFVSSSLTGLEFPTYAGEGMLWKKPHQQIIRQGESLGFFRASTTTLEFRGICL